MKNYGAWRNNIKWFESYINNRKQFINFPNKNTNFADIKCGVPQGSILRPLLFLINVNDLNRASDILYPIMLADGSNLFYSHKDFKTLFHTVNTELVKVNHSFKANNLSLNVKNLIVPFFINLQLKTI